jgi:hypothetical protein
MNPTEFPDDPSCAALPPLRDPLFDSLRSELDTFDTPPGVRKELLAAFARQHAAAKAARPWWRRLPVLAGSGAVLAALLVTALLHFTMPPLAPAPAIAAASAAPIRFGAFIALDTLERIAQDPNPHVLVTEVPRTSLVSLGVAVNPQDAGDMVQAEMLVGAAGNPLALRLALQ